MSKEHTPPAQALPRLENCGTYLAKDNKGQWHYVNHANSWCAYQGPAQAPDQDVPLQTVSEADLREALKLLTTIMRPSMSNLIISAIKEQAAIIAHMKRTSHARRLAFEAAMSDATPSHPMKEED